MSGDKPIGRAALLRVVNPELVPEDDNSTVHIGHVVRRRRQEAGLTQEQAAAKAGLTRNAIAAIEKNPSPDPRLSTLLRLVRAYQLLSIDQLLGPSPTRDLANTWSFD